MKKIITLFTLWLLAFGLYGCRINTPYQYPSPESTENTDINEQTEEKVWSEQDISALFSDVKKEDWEFIDSVLIPDKTYDRIGAVLFRDNNKRICYVAFFDADGDFHQCGTNAEIADDPDFTYLGNCTVSFNLKADDDTIYTYTLSLSIDGNNVSFKAEDSLSLDLPPGE